MKCQAEHCKNTDVAPTYACLDGMGDLFGTILLCKAHADYIENPWTNTLPATAPLSKTKCCCGNPNDETRQHGFIPEDRSPSEYNSAQCQQWCPQPMYLKKEKMWWCGCGPHGMPCHPIKEAEGL